MRGTIDLTGKVFDRLTVTSRAESGKSKHSMWNCICSCGNKKTIRGDALRGGKARCVRLGIV